MAYIYNAVPENNEGLNINSINIIKNTFKYIYKKLGKNGNLIMIPDTKTNENLKIIYLKISNYSDDIKLTNLLVVMNL